MATLKWIEISAPETGDDTTVMASRFQLRSRRQVLGFLRAALAIRRQVRQSPGALGISLIAEPLKARFWTLSAWSDQAALEHFVKHAPHAPIMSKYRAHMRDARFKFWTVPAAELPAEWADARARLADSERSAESGPG
jgi:quinol monooxygenase YgiN